MRRTTATICCLMVALLLPGGAAEAKPDLPGACALKNGVMIFTGDHALFVSEGWLEVGDMERIDKDHWLIEYPGSRFTIALRDKGAVLILDDGEKTDRCVSTRSA